VRPRALRGTLGAVAGDDAHWNGARRPGAGARDGRPLRGNGVRRPAAHARDRHPHGRRRDAAANPDAGVATGLRADGARRRGRLRRGDSAGVPDALDLPGLSPVDPRALLSTGALLAAAALTASLVPAWRAARV